MDLKENVSSPRCTVHTTKCVFMEALGRVLPAHHYAHKCDRSCNQFSYWGENYLRTLDILPDV